MYNGSTENLFMNMTLRQKIGQMVMVRAYDYREKLGLLLNEGTVGGIGSVMFARDCHTLEDAVESLNRFYHAARLPLLLFADAEAGIADIFKFGTSFPTSMALGATRSQELAYKMGNAIATEAASLGLGMLGSPVLDINTNPDNPIIGTRAFSDRPELAIKLGLAYVKGMQDAGVIPLGKHFPGHGDTHQDSHSTLPSVDRGKDYLMNMDVRPFIELMNHGMQGIMTSHIIFSNLLDPDEERVPVTFSETILNKLVRTELGFNGLIVTDSLAMKGIKDLYGEEQCAIRAINAGHNIILQDYGSDPDYTIDTIQSAVEAGIIPEWRIDDSVKRIWEVKARLNIPDRRLLEAATVKQIVGSGQHQSIAKEIADLSVTVLENRSLPFPAITDAKILVVVTTGDEEETVLEDLQTAVTSKVSYLFHSIKQYNNQVEMIVLNEQPEPEQIERLKQKSREYTHIIYAAFVRMVSYKEGSGTVQDSQLEVINFLNDSGKDVAFIIFGNPYLLRKTNRLQNCLCTYSDCRYSIDSGLKVLFGRQTAQGKLPVTINETYRFGYGL